MDRAKVRKALFVLRRDPVLLARKVVSKVDPRPAPRKKTTGRVRGVVFEFDFELGEQIVDMYRGRYEMETIRAMSRLLGPGDVFLDVGANIGYISAIAMALVGPSGETHSFEPVPRYFQRLKRLADMNPSHRLIPNQCALGERVGSIDIQVADPILVTLGSSSVVTGLLDEGTIDAVERVALTTLDAYVNKLSIQQAHVIKVDAEGYEFPVLRGFRESLERMPKRPRILCEVTPKALSLLGHSLTEFAAYMDGFGYVATSPIDFGYRVELAALPQDTHTNLVFLGPDDPLLA